MISGMSASSCHRWLECPGSVRLIQKAERVEREYAKEGTDAHALAEFYLKNKKGEIPKHLKYLSESADHEFAIRSYVLAVNNEIRKGCLVEIEKKMNPKSFNSDLSTSTVDALIVEPFGTLTVVDLKYGVIKVPVENNPQLMYYALLAVHEYGTFEDFSNIKFMIVQPRDYTDDDNVRSWEIPPMYLKKWYEETLLPGVERVKSKNPEFKTGSWCTFCDAITICPVVEKHIDMVMRLKESDIINFDNEKIASILNKAPLIKRYLNVVNDLAFSRLNSDQSIPGFKLVAKRGLRKWDDTSEVEDIFLLDFGEQIYKPKELLSPAQMQKIGIPRNEIDKLCTSVSSGLKMVTEKTEGVEYQSSAEQDFKKIK